MQSERAAFDPQPVTLRIARRVDLPALECDCQYTHYRRLFADAFQRQQNGETILWLAVLPSGGIIGQAFVQLNGARPELADGWERAYVYSVRVQAPYRNRGVGAQIMTTVEDDLRQRGFSQVTLTVGKHNLAARRLYERLGYAVIADEDGDWSYLDHRGKRQFVHEPAWRMEKWLR